MAGQRKKSDADTAQADEAFAEGLKAQEELADKPLGPAQPAPVEGVPADPEAEKKDSSPADLELRLPPLSAGPTIVVKANPETPSPQMVAASLSQAAGPPVTKLTVTDADDNEQEAVLAPDDAALLAQRTLSQQPQHPAFTTQGHWHNPNFPIDATEEEIEKDQKEYASRFGRS